MKKSSNLFIQSIITLVIKILNIELNSIALQLIKFFFFKFPFNLAENKSNFLPTSFLSFLFLIILIFIIILINLSKFCKYVNIVQLLKVKSL